MMPKHVMHICVICYKPFKKSPKLRTKGRRPVGVRRGNSVTCSNKCSKDNRNKLQYNECECGDEKSRGAKICHRCYTNNLERERNLKNKESEDKDVE